MADLSAFPPPTSETVETIRSRVDADANAGVDPESEEFLDTTPGGFWWDLTQAVVLELDRVYDFAGTEVPAAMISASSWGDYLDLHGEAVGLERREAVAATGEVTFTGTNGVVIGPGTEVGTSSPDPEVESISFLTTESGTISGGTVTVAVEAVEAGAAGNVGSGSINSLLSSIESVASVANVDATTGGADVESDESFRNRIVQANTRPHGGGTMADYERMMLGTPGIGYVTVVPNWSGPGTVRVILTDLENDPVSAAVVTDRQEMLDPVAGQGLGMAPIGATVTVATPAAVTVNSAMTLELDSGYTLDGTGGTISVRADVESAVRAYIDSLPPGQEVVINRVRSQAFLIPGVHDVPAITLNGAGTDVAITLSPPQVAQSGTVTLT